MKNCTKYQSAIKIRDVAGTPTDTYWHVLTHSDTYKHLQTHTEDLKIKFCQMAPLQKKNSETKKRSCYERLITLAFWGRLRRPVIYKTFLFVNVIIWNFT